MVMGSEPFLPFLLSDVPGDVAVPVAAFAGTSMFGMARLIKWLITQLLDENRMTRETLSDLTDAVRNNTRENREDRRRDA